MTNSKEASLIIITRERILATQTEKPTKPSIHTTHLHIEPIHKKQSIFHKKICFFYLFTEKYIIQGWISASASTKAHPP
uniref:Uncharacterized protein n=1 Tax=Candidatus Kentrum sp. MB TaxID=2138164 RepID=A0A450X855_9GAMM|nr:MAG: hypothetical protein BECKMB1821G_GA0114241_101327 [Candidatus Kentron sp. MB]VFK29143.1 MAG: hypothetical protein BECKMB1821I_GA0114274_100849 [Candidatus Kentron sp. MB]VFK74689.1 MAG: hypothetical protein BECKMB1821H_GA0114242_100848 [Candidatus Kentron sp. MB]